MLDETVESCVDIDPEAPARIQLSYGLPQGRPLRFAYVAGPGDVAGTFEYWRAGQFDPRVPVIAYSTQFYTLVDKIDAEALILCESEELPSDPHPRFRFVRTPRRRDSLGRIAYRLEMARYARAVLREIRAFDPDVVLVGTDSPVAVFRGLPARTRAVMTLHNTFWPMGRRPTSLKARLKLAWTARALRRVGAAVCTSPECRTQFIALTSQAEGVFVQTPQVLAQHAGDGRERDALRRILFLGRIESDKGIFDLLEVFDGVADTHPELSLVFAGTGSAEDALREAISQARNRDRIAFPGKLTADEVHASLEEADLLVCPTRSAFPEGLAMVVIEATIHGVPTLLSSVVPAKELFQEAVVEFPADDVEALRSALQHLVSSPEDYRSLSRSAQEGSDAFFDRSRSWGSQLYRALLVAAGR